MKKLFTLVAFVLGGLALALAGQVPAHAMELVPPTDQTQKAINDNSTYQKASADAYTNQKNINVPVSVLSFGSNNGNVDQSNKADTQANAKNSNGTDQGIWQGQKSQDGSGQDQYAKNDNSTEQKAYSDATTKQANINVPIAILSYGSNNGDVNQSNKADTQANAKNSNSTDQSIAQEQKSSSSQRGKGYEGKGYNGDNGQSQGQDQYAKNDNQTEQKSYADAYTKQVNVNAPISVLSFGSNNGNVDQSNKADTQANAKNSNWTDQGIAQEQSSKSHDNYGQKGDYGQKGHDGYDRSMKDGSQGQDQYAKNNNETEQKSHADAYTQQKNVNAPISVLSFGSNNGDVNQSNKACTEANAKNSNGTDQSIWQGQKSQDGQQAHKGDRYDRKNNDGSNGGQDQYAKNNNETEQKSHADAYTQQKNFNAPFSFLSFGSNNGNVDQHNKADTIAHANNANYTGQWIGQMQTM